MALVERRARVFCITCSFAPDDLFFPVIVTCALKGTWFLFSFFVFLSIFALPGCDDGISIPLAVSVIGFTSLQLVSFIHKFVLLLASARGTIREPNHTCVRELLLTGVAIYVVEVVWGAYCVAAVINQVSAAGTICERLHRPVTAYVVLVWINWLELALLALIYFSCLDRYKCFCCRAVCTLQFRCCRKVPSEGKVLQYDPELSIDANIKVTPSSRNISASQLSNITREKLCTCRRDGLNNSKNIALLDLSHAMEVLYHDIKVHYTALDRLSGWMLVQKYHTQLLRQDGGSLVTEELLQATLQFLKKKGVIDRNYVVRKPQSLELTINLSETLLYYFWFAMASYGWPVKVFLEPLAGVCTLCKDASVRCFQCARRCREQEMETSSDEQGPAVFFKSAEVASISGIKASDIILGKTASDIHCPPFYVCRTTRRDQVTGELMNEAVITIRGTLSVKDVMTSFTASMRDATKCQESLVEKWFTLLVKTKLTFLGVEDAYFHTGFYKSAKVILNILRKSNAFRDLVEKKQYRVVVTGHSLGAGVGAVLTLLIKQKHPHWAEGLHAYLFSVPGAVCSYKLACKAEEMGLITSVVGANDIVPRISWRALTYLKLLVKKALEETELKKQEVLCCGNMPNWDPPVFQGSVHPIGLLDEQSEAENPQFLELQDSLPVIRRSTWEQESVKKEKREKIKQQRELARNGNKVVEDEDVEYQERRRTGVECDMEEPRKKQQEQVELEDNEDQVKKVATEFLQEKCHLGPLMFIPGKVLHIEEEKESNERWCGLDVLGLRCCGIRCKRERQVKVRWKARENMTGIILHKDCLVDHSPRRMFAMLKNLSQQVQSSSESGNNETTQSLSPIAEVASDMEAEPDEKTPSERNVHDSQQSNTVEISVEVYDHSEL